MTECTTESALARSHAAAQNMVDGRVVAKTRVLYQSKMKQMQKWFEVHHLDFTLPFNSKDTISFFGSLIDRDGKSLAFSSVRAYKSALKYHYKEHRLVFDETLEIDLENFLKGYKRKVSDMKLAGEIDVFEGKHHITFTSTRRLPSYLHISMMNLQLRQMIG